MDIEDDCKPAAGAPVAFGSDSRVATLYGDGKETESGEIPFLITHWLDGFTADRSKHGSTHDATIQSIRGATATLASAFESLGSFGRRLDVPHIGTSIISSLPTNKSYSDMKRSWAAACPPSHLESIVTSVKNANEAVDVTAASQAPTNYVKRCGEIILEQRRKTPGRTLNEVTDVEKLEKFVNECSGDCVATKMQSALQRPPLIVAPIEPEFTGRGLNYSSLGILKTAASKSTRRYLDLVEASKTEAAQISSHKRSLMIQRQSLSALEMNQRSYDTFSLADDKEASKNNCLRVIAQIERALPTLVDRHRLTVNQLERSRTESHKDFKLLSTALSTSRDPIVNVSAYKGNHRLHFVYSQQLRGKLSKAAIQKSVLYNRFHHAGTINTHLTYPVFCLKFDKTGRYFITGADDYLVKIFCLASATQRRVNNEPIRGAVLVCTLKGHAGVINDIQISPDNCFVATASEDGDVRVWGLYNGCPIAVLRGHVGGANMVSWAMSIPYQLITTGADGLARVWDIRKACLRRYKMFTGNRTEYTLNLTKVRKTKDAISIDHLPFLDDGPQDDSSANAVSAPTINAQNIDIPLPPLPPAPGIDGMIENILPGGNESGHFVANNRIDEGVKLLSKLQHGSPSDGIDSNLPGTRSRLSTVKVICVAHCPKGGHFATGSDDGVCRVWNGNEDDFLIHIDVSKCFHSQRVPDISAINPHDIPGEKPLLILKGHLSAITDLEYSKGGDRLMTASQKDGVVRVWSWDIDPCVPSMASPRIVSHIIIELSNPQSRATALGGSGSRRRPSRSPVTDISCDIARWLSDDIRIVTSQCEYTRQNTSNIVPGSQFIFIWDSIKGHCLMCIDNAHRMPCPLVLPHPHLSSVICSAGADGWLKVWDLERSECVFSFENIAEYGPFDPNDREKSVGFLDGDMSPDGADLVLTDDSGRVIVFSSSGDIPSGSFPGWAREQYFSNDYYDLIYDNTGYCVRCLNEDHFLTDRLPKMSQVERGSEMPPHLAPKGSRCTHSGSPSSVQVNESLSNMFGPAPISESVARRNRIQIREERGKLQRTKFRIGGHIISQYDPTTTIMVNNTACQDTTASTMVTNDHLANSTESRSRRNANRHLSSNYQWMDFEDLERETGNDDNEVVDPDDEEFDPSENRRRTSRPLQSADDSASEDDQLDDFDADLDEDVYPSRTPKRRNEGRHNQLSASEDSADEYVEYMSTNNTPSGPFVADYSSHLFKMASQAQANNLHRRWLQRVESTSSYEGRRRYAPQIGDLVVYIPRAHYDTIARFPSLEAPWQNWPNEASWPVVQCRIRNIRYRFPYIHYRDGCRSIVAKLTLELTGVPELLIDRRFGWPVATFQDAATAHFFEISVFETDETDFVIPYCLYESRLRQLEKALESGEPVVVDAFYATENEDEEFLSYQGKLVETPLNQDTIVQPSLVGSGYHAVSISWPEEPSSIDYASPWELSVRYPESAVGTPLRPRLNENDKRAVRDTLNHIRSINDFSECFGFPVNESYSDYMCRVEIPMDLSFIADRIEADYYATKFSFVADVRLIMTNCIKYNGEHDSLSLTAANMLEEVKKKLLGADELRWFQEYDKPLPGSQPTGNLIQWDQTGASTGNDDAESAPERQQRLREPQSSLEGLSGPAADPTRRSARAVRPPRRLEESLSSPMGIPTRRSTRPRLHQRRTRATTRSVLEGPIRTLEQLSSSGGGYSRGRSLGYGRRGRPTNTLNPPPRRSTRNNSDNQRHISRSSARLGLRNSIQSTLDNDSSHGARGSRPTRRINPNELASLEGITASGRARLQSEIVQQAPFASSDSSSSEDTKSEEEYSQHDDSVRDSTDESKVDDGSQRARSSRQSKSNGRSGKKPSETNIDADEQPLGRSRAQKRSRSDVEKGRESNDNRTGDVDVTTDDNESSFNEQESDVDDELVKLSDDDLSLLEGPIEPKHKKNTRRKGKTDGTSRTLRKRRRQALDVKEDVCRRSRTRGMRASYEDPSSSDFNDDSDEGVPRTKRSGHPVAKKPKASNDETRKRQGYIQKRMKFHGVTTWPAIALGHITKVTNEVVRRFKELDEGEIFHVPVASAYPEIAHAYLKAVAHPMDLRTIIEDRLHRYRSIRELQEDLLLVFDNCIVFNEEGSPLHETAATMIGLMDSTFEAVCVDLNVRCLRH